MDVAFSASLVSPIVEAEANGPHAVIVDLARGLAERGHRMTVYAAAGSSVDGVELVEIPVSDGAHLARIRPGGVEGLGDRATVDLHADFARMLDTIGRGGHDVLSQHAFDAPALRIAAALPVLHTLHLPPMVDAVVRAARATAAPLAAVSRASRADWRAAGVHPAWLLRNGVPDRGPGIGPPEPAALVAGRVSPEKGTEAAIRAGLAAGLRVWVAGDVYERDYFEARVRPLLDRAEYLGPVPRPELSALMARAAVLLMPVAWREPFGLVAAEAQMAGCPVVAHRLGALPEVVEDGVSGILVEPGDATALASAIDAAISLPRAAVRASALRRLGVEPMIDAYERALTRVRDGVRGPVAG